MDTQNSVVGECPTQNPSNDFKAGEFAQPPLVLPVAPLEAAKTHYYPALRNITTRELSFFLPDDSFTSVRDLAEFFPSLKAAELFLHTFRLAHPEFNYTHLSVVKSSIAEPVQNFMQTQCWICPHCFNDEHHQSDVNGCEWQYKQDAIDAARYRFLRGLDIQILDSSGVFAAADGLFLDSDSIDDIIDKAMEVV